MKTGMEWPLLGVLVVAVLVGLWNAWSGLQVDLSAGSVNALAASQAAPDPVVVAGGWVVKAIIGTLIGGTVTAGAAALFVWVRGQMRKQATEQKQWKAGPNANWGHQAQPKPLSDADLMRYMMMQQMGGFGERGSPRRTTLTRLEEDDDQTINF